MSLTAATVAREFLDPSLDARALNLDQQALLLDPSPEADSVLELLDGLRGGQLSGSSHRELARLCAELSASNVLEGESETALAGAADSLVHDLRDRERNGEGVRQALTAKAIARRLRGPLAALASPAGTEASVLVEAGRVVAEAIDGAPRVQLLGPAVRHELGEPRYQLLARLTAARKKNGAASLGATGTAATRRSSAHGAE